jgi:hypothetical protein
MADTEITLHTEVPYSILHRIDRNVVVSSFLVEKRCNCHAVFSL